MVNKYMDDCRLFLAQNYLSSVSELTPIQRVVICPPPPINMCANVCFYTH